MLATALCVAETLTAAFVHARQLMDHERVLSLCSTQSHKLVVSHLVERLCQRLNRDAGCAGSAGSVVEELHNCMAADETFGSVQALQDAIAKDVEQRIATAHMRPLPSKTAAARGASILNGAPGDILVKSIDRTPDSKHAKDVPGPHNILHVT